jgi:hypothetical protein
MAASFWSRLITCTVVPFIWFMRRMQEAHMPAPALGAPNTDSEIFSQESFCHLICKFLFIFTGSFSHFFCHLNLPLGFSVFCVGIVISSNNNHHPRLGVDHKLPGSELQGEGHLVEDSTQLLQSQDMKSVGGDCHPFQLCISETF